jgi:hypothetical protein
MMYRNVCVLKDALPSSIIRGFSITSNNLEFTYTSLDGPIPNALIPRVYYLQSLVNPVIGGYA